jgi:SET domain-containing protein
MVNDSKKGTVKNNAEMKIIPVDGKPHLCLFAYRDIAVNEELRFDYGVDTLPWRTVCLCSNSTSW